jgi:hypothetical protein
MYHCGKDAGRWTAQIKQLIEAIKVAKKEKSFIAFG